MTPANHKDKAERIEASLAKCQAGDYEAVIEACMLAGTHWFNIALHDLGLTAAEDDALHAEYMTAALRLKLSLVAPRLLQALDGIEHARAGYVRGNLAGGTEAARQCRERLELLRQIAVNAVPFNAGRSR